MTSRSPLRGSSTLRFSLSKAQEEVGEYTIVMPLYHVAIQEPFELGKVAIRTLSREDIDRLIARQTKHDPEHADAIQIAGDGALCRDVCRTAKGNAASVAEVSQPFPAVSLV